MKPTVESIWKSFHDSGKRHLLLTGSRGSGKTTRFRELSAGMPGLTSYAVPGSHVALRDNLTGGECIIGSFDGTAMTPTEGLETFGVSALEKAISHPSGWLAIDELGYLESHCPSYQQTVFRALDSKQVLAVVRKQHTPFLDQLLVRPDVYVVDLDRARLTVGCVIMASGLSRRFGSNKLLADFHGQTLLERILDTTEGLFHRRVVVTRSEAAAEICRRRNVQVLVHTLPHRSDTVRLGAEQLQDMDALVFCPCDQPLLRRSSLETLMDALLLHEDQILRMSWENTPGTPILFPRYYYNALCNLPVGKGGGFLAARHPDKVVYISAENPYELYDADTPADLEKLKKVPV